MEFKQSITLPEIEVSKCGKVRWIKNKQYIMPQLSHSMSIRGPALYVRVANYTKQVSLRTLVYETWVVNRQTRKGEYIDSLNDDDNDCRAENLVRATNYKGQKRTDSAASNPRHDSWMGGDDIYIY